MLGTETETIEHLDFDEPITCEGRNHPYGTFGHGGPASFFAAFPCGHSNGYRCTGVVTYLKALLVVRCAHCPERYGPDEIRFTPLSSNT